MKNYRRIRPLTFGILLSITFFSMNAHAGLLDDAVEKVRTLLVDTRQVARNARDHAFDAKTATVDTVSNIITDPIEKRVGINDNMTQALLTDLETAITG